MDLDKLRDQFYEKFPFEKLVPLDIRIRWAVVAAVPILVFVLAYTQLIVPGKKLAGEKNEILINKTNELLMKESLNRRMKEFEQEVAALDAQLEIVKAQLPEKKEIPNLLDQVSNLGTQSSMEFVTFKPMGESEKDFYAEVPVQLKMVGKFHDLVSFFDKIGRMPRIMTIADLTIEPSRTKRKLGQSANLVIATCKAITFRFIEARVDEPKEDETGKKKKKKRKRKKKGGR